jgi:curved DNA-binding protein CbpA
MNETGKTFYDILGLPKEATTAQVSDAFRKLVREHHPDRFKDLAQKAEAEHFLKDVTEAYNTLSKAALRQEYDKSFQRLQSSAVQKSPQEQLRELIAGGLSRYRSGDYTSALAMFDHALRIEPGNDLALFHAGMVRLKNPRWRTQGTQQAEKAIELNPFSVQYAREYGEFLIENGLALRAQRLLEKALESHPTDEGLQVLISRTREGEKPTGFSLFRKK